MGTVSWYRLFNNTAFIALGLPSFVFTVDMEERGQKDIEVFRGNYTSVLYDDVFLSINMNAKNPFRLNDLAVWLDENADVWLGIYHAD